MTSSQFENNYRMDLIKSQGIILKECHEIEVKCTSNREGEKMQSGNNMTTHDYRNSFLVQK
jgi:hypothetical protein